MEKYNRKVSYSSFKYKNPFVLTEQENYSTDLPSSVANTIVTASTLYFPLFLTQNIEDVGYYTDTKNPVYEIVNFAGRWDLSTNNGVDQIPCLVLNNCNATFVVNTPISFNGAGNGSISVLIQGCPGPHTLEWSGPGGFSSTNSTINNLDSGTYTVKITDSSCNMTYATYYLTQPQSLSLILESTSSQTNVTTPGGCNGTAEAFPVGGVAPYTYTWYLGNTIIAGPSQTISGLTSLCAGQYTVQITDSAGNPTTVSRIFNITEPTPISGTVVTKTGVICSGDDTGSLTVNAVGGVHPTGYTFNLTGPVSTSIVSNGGATFNNLFGGNYNVQILDAVGNTVTLPVTITANTQLTASISSTSPQTGGYYITGCYNVNNGNLTVTPNGGTLPYTLEVSQNGVIINSFGQTTLTNTNPYTLNNLKPGDYNIILNDANNCTTTTQTIQMRQRPLLNLSINQINTINGYNIRCFGGTTGITVNTSYTTNSTTIAAGPNQMKYYVDGVLKYTIPVGPSNNVPLTNIGAGNHILTIIDSYNCSATTTFTLTQPPLALSFVGSPNIDIINVNPAVCLPACIAPAVCQQAIVGVNGGVAPYNIVWRMLPGNVAWGTGISSNPFCSSNLYTSLQVTVTDNNGCVITSSINV